MIKVSVFYANGEGKHFDMDYYCQKHVALVRRLCGAAIKGISVEQGTSGGAPGSAPQYLAMGHVYFESMDSFNAAFGPNMKEIVADVPNYTNIQPVLQVSEVKL